MNAQPLPEGGGRVGGPTSRTEEWPAPVEAGSRYDHLFQTVPVGLFRMSPSGSLMDANAKLRDILGLPKAGSASGYNFFEFCVDPESADRWRTRLRTEGCVDDAMLAMRRSDGSVIHTQIGAVCLTDGGGAVVSLEGSVVDVTAHHTAERALEDAEARFRALVERGWDLVNVIGPDGTFVYSSPSVTRILGYHPDELVGRRFTELIHPDDLDVVAAPIDAIQDRAGTSIRVGGRFRAKDGTWRHFELSATNLLEDPAVRGIVTNAHDVTERVEADRRYRSLFDNVPVGLYTSTPEGVPLNANPSLVEILGFDSKESYLAIRLPSLYVDPGVREVWLESIQRDGTVRNFEKHLRRPDGSIIWIRDSATGIRDEQGNIVQYDGFVEDITEQRLAEQLLREAEARYRNLVEQIPAVAYIISSDGGQTLYVSPQIGAILGLSPEEWKADPEMWRRQLHPDDRARAEAARRTLVETGHPYSEEYRLFAMDGVEHWVQDRADVMRDERGRSVAIQGVMADITDLKRTEEALRETVARMSAVMESAIDCIITMDHEGRIEEFNPAAERTFGRRRDEVVGRPLVDQIIPEHLRERHRRGLERFVQTGEAVVIGKRLELTGMRADGSEFPLELIIAAVEGVPPRFIGYLRDITERKAREQELRETVDRLHEGNEERRKLLARLVAAQEEERQRLAGDIHDDPIQVMAAAAIRLEIVERACLDPRSQSMIERTAKTMQDAIERLRRLVFELRPPALQQEGLAVALRQYLDRMADETDLAFGVDNRMTEELPPDVRATAYRIAQEALANVRKHAEADRVDILLEHRDRGLLARIRDDGVGFSPAGASQGARAGHLGLEAMLERAEAVGGWCHVESSEGAGTTVEFWIPSEGDTQE